VNTVVQAFFHSLETQLHYSESTRAAYRSDLQIFLKHLRENLNREPRLSDFDEDHISGFFEAEQKVGRRPNTLLRRKAAIIRFEQYLHQKGLLPENSRDINAKLSHFFSESRLEKETQPNCLTKNQVDQLINLLEESARPLARRDQAILTVLLETGMAASSLIALDLTDLDLRRGMLRIPDHNYTSVWLPLSDANRQIERYLKESRPELNPSASEAALFISQNGMRMSRQGLWQMLRQLGVQVQLPVTLSPRLVRHTAAIRMSQAGKQLGDIQKSMGHTNPLSTHALLHRLRAELSDL
jgi:integrase/recombinase XerD